MGKKANDNKGTNQLLALVVNRKLSLLAMKKTRKLKKGGKKKATPFLEVCNTSRGNVL